MFTDKPDTDQLYAFYTRDNLFEFSVLSIIQMLNLFGGKIL